MELSDKALRMSRVGMNHEFKHKYPVEKRIEVVTKVLALGNMRLVSELTGVSYQLIRQWKAMPWWNELVDEIRASRNAALDTKLSKLVDKSLEVVADRVEYGNIYMDKKGELQRKPLTALEANKIAVDMLNQETLVQKRQMAESEGMQVASMADMMRDLAKQFAAFNRTSKAGATDLPYVERTDNAVHDEREEGLQEAICEVRWETGPDQSSFGEESSESDGGEEDWEHSEQHGCGPQDSAEQGGEEYSVQPARSFS
jgi:hypothetical protein